MCKSAWVGGISGQGSEAPDYAMLCDKPRSAWCPGRQCRQCRQSGRTTRTTHQVDSGLPRTSCWRPPLTEKNPMLALQRRTNSILSLANSTDGEIVR